MKAVQLGDYVCIYADHSLPEVYRDRAIHVETVPERPEGRYRMGIEDGQLVWVESPKADHEEPAPEETGKDQAAETGSAEPAEPAAAEEVV